MAGKILNHYRIEGKIGRGGMADVHQAEDTKLNRKVTLRVLPSERAGDRVGAK